MREIMCIIRSNKINATKKALAESGFPAFTCRKCSGRGKRMLDPEVLNMVMASGELPMNEMGETISEAMRLVSRRVITFIVEDTDVKKAVDAVMGANQTGNPGDGKIFVIPIMEAYTVSTGETTVEAY